ncbi:UNVERIFIED_CONTAM: hypothetical protein Sradi_2040200 [Sesamum radiatum]|uniref:Uncharacterized protein n=1 Tax=Sesamum radiatum TaxID=300843 RepID=A0AAW2TH74_SESRA
MSNFIYKDTVPVKPCFAMTVNKAQGQTLDFVGVYLREPVFSHGQLYVALSRAKTGNSVKWLFEMHRPLVPVAEVTPNTKNWTTKVLVIQKLSPRQSQSSPKKYQRFLFIDKDVYVLAIVVDKLEQKSINTKYGLSTIQEFVVVNDEKKPMILTLWNEVISIEGASILAATDKMPIIATTRLHMTDYNGKVMVQNKKLDCDAINKRLNGRRFIVQIKKKTVDTHYGIGYHYNIASLIEEDVNQPPKVHVKECSSSHSHVVDSSTIGTDPDVASSSVSLPKNMCGACWSNSFV